MAPWAIVAVFVIFARDPGPDRTGSSVYAIALLVLLLAQGAYKHLKWWSEERSDRGG